MVEQSTQTIPLQHPRPPSLQPPSLQHPRSLSLYHSVYSIQGYPVYHVHVHVHPVDSVYGYSLHYPVIQSLASSSIQSTSLLGALPVTLSDTSPSSSSSSYMEISDEDELGTKIIHITHFASNNYSPSPFI